LPIGELAATPDSYHLKEVLLHGTVQHLKMLDPYTLPSGLQCRGAYVFMLEDETGAVEVAVPGWCGKQLPREVHMADGDRVAVRAEVHAPGLSGFSLDMMGRPFSPSGPSEGERPLHAIAKTITHLGQ
jgi:hypothetical protein